MAKSDHYKNQISDCSDDEGMLFKVIGHLRNGKGNKLPQHSDLLALCYTFNEFFATKMSQIRRTLNDVSTSYTPNQSRTFTPTSTTEVHDLVKLCSTASRNLQFIPAKLIKSGLLKLLISAITKIANASIPPGIFPHAFKEALVNPLVKKSSLDPDVLKNY